MTIAQLDRPSLSERYEVAAGSGASMEHMILAAGMQHEQLGAMLMRLQGQFDAVRGELERAGQIAPQRAEQARDLMRRAVLADRLQDSAAANILRRRAAEIRGRTTAEVLTARALILMGLKSLRATKDRFGAFALGLAVQPKRGVRVTVAKAIAGQVLEVWLDPTCHVCDGTGRVGNVYAGEVRRQCDTCAGSGHRRDIIGRTPHERIFARDLMAEIQRRVAVAAGGIGRALAPPEAETPDSGELRGMNGRLANMRAAAAQTD